MAGVRREPERLGQHPAHRLAAREIAEIARVGVPDEADAVARASIDHGVHIVRPGGQQRHREGDVDAALRDPEAELARRAREAGAEVLALVNVRGSTLHREAGRAVVRLEDVGDPATLQAIAGSLEPEGGSPNPAAPSGPVVMVGKVSD